MLGGAQGCTNDTTHREIVEVVGLCRRGSDKKGGIVNGNKIICSDLVNSKLCLPLCSNDRFPFGVSMIPDQPLLPDMGTFPGIEFLP